MKQKIAELQKKLQEAEEQAEKRSRYVSEQVYLQDGELEMLASGARSRTSPPPNNDDLLMHLPSQALQPCSAPWNIGPSTVKRKRLNGPIDTDAHGHPRRLVQLGERIRMNRSN